MKSPNVTFFPQSDLEYTENDLKLGKNDLKYYDLKWDFPLGGLYLGVNMGCALVISFQVHSFNGPPFMGSDLGVPSYSL